VSSSVFITVVLGILAANVASVTVIAKLLGDRIGDVVGRMDRLEKRSDERFDSVETRLDGISETLVRFDGRLHALERP
jgi:uncharacterized membrane protein YqgA involved in biofilm formation